MRIEFSTLPIEQQLEKVVLLTTEQAIEKYYTKLATKEWLSIKEACEYIGVAYNTFQKLRERGLKVAEIDGIKRVSKKEIDSFLVNNSY